MNASRITHWSVEERPREKLIHQGPLNLSNTELVAILIGSGSPNSNAVDLSRRILQSVDFDLHRLAAMDCSDLTKFHGIGLAKAVAIVSAMELGRRRAIKESPTPRKISGSNDIYQLMKPFLLDKRIESFWVVYLNRAHRVLQIKMISQGGVSGTLVDPKLIFKFALDLLASSMVLVHNHPSGQLKPSTADQALTQKLKSAGQTLEIPVLDHIIFTNSGYFSFADESLM